MLEQFNGKRVKILTEDGELFTGQAEHYPSGYGLELFGQAEESLLIEDTHLFPSEIRSITDLDAPAAPPIQPRQFDELMGRLLEGPYRIIDRLPERVPARDGGRFFAVERYFLQPQRQAALRRAFAELLLLLSCYDEMAVSFDACASWERDPDPEPFAARVEALAGNAFLRAVFPAQGAMIDLEPCDLFMTVYGGEGAFLRRLEQLAAAQGCFLWEA